MDFTALDPADHKGDLDRENAWKQPESHCQDNVARRLHDHVKWKEHFDRGPIATQLLGGTIVTNRQVQNHAQKWVHECEKHNSKQDGSLRPYCRTVLEQWVTELIPPSASRDRASAVRRQLDCGSLVATLSLPGRVLTCDQQNRLR